MDKIINYLKQLELSDVEAKLYLTLLKTGPISVRKLAASSEMKRTTSYLYIDQLIERGLIIKVVKGSQKVVAATDPKDGLEYLVKKKVESAEEVKQNLPSILDSLLHSLPASESMDDAEVRYYKGKNGVKKIYEDALTSKELRSYANLSEIAAIFPENEELFVNSLHKNKDLTLYEIVEDSPWSRDQTKLFTQNERYSYKFLPKDVKISAADVLIYDGKVGIINLRSKITGVILHNTDYFNICKELFDFVWKTLPAIEDPQKKG